MAVSRDDVRRMAALARIGVPEERLEALVRELGGILDHMDVLARADAAAPDVPPADGMPLAPDEPGAVPLAIPRETFAPKMRDGFFLVPRLSTHDGEGSS